MYISDLLFHNTVTYSLAMLDCLRGEDLAILSFEEVLIGDPSPDEQLPGEHIEVSLPIADDWGIDECELR